MAAERLGSHRARELTVLLAVEVEGIVKLQQLHASRRGVPGAALRPWVWVLPSFTSNGSMSGLVDRERPHGRRKVSTGSFLVAKGAHLSVFLFFFFSLSSSFFLPFSSSFLLPSELRGGRGGALALRWMEDCEAGNTRSRATRTQGGWLPVERIRGETRTAAVRACSGRERGNYKNGFTSSRQARWREGLAGNALVKEIG
uniref:Uncharacterized protein n=1 Tax=Oryza glumipatula TaxID=40148 RepID=A0A0E0BR53_9ORYZ